MYRCFEELKGKGYTLCALHPFRHSFYQKFGFVTYIKVRVHTISFSGEDGFDLADIEEDMLLVKRLYDSFMTPCSGYAVRDLEETRRRFEEFKATQAANLSLRGKPSVMCISTTASPGVLRLAGGGPHSQLNGRKVCLPLTARSGTDRFYHAEGARQGRLLAIFGTTRFWALSDEQLVRALTGSWGQFGTELPEAVAGKYFNLTNFVFDKY